VIIRRVQTDHPNPPTRQAICVEEGAELSNFDPFDQLALGTSPVRRRDLREPSTRRSRRAARKRAEAQRKLRKAVKTVAKRPGNTRPPRKPIGKRIAKALVSVVALALAASFAIATAGSPLLFSSASAAPTSAITPSKASSTINGQHIADATSKDASISRDSFAALSAQQLYSLEVGGLDYTVNNSGPIRWPFDYPVPLGDHFGTRPAPCSGCSTFHRGTDFETGDGAPIYAVAAGVVTVSELSGALGQHVEISHVVNGHAFTSVYGHMRANSEVMYVGETIVEGQPVGLTGTTGESTGPHLDFEIDINGVPVDSFVWLKANTAH
jgi:murein DD-endopeptidase MepM/ murein hydrolase activator NlpD